MLEAVLFDFNATLIRAEAWMELEIHTFPDAALDVLLQNGYLAAISGEERASARQAFLNLREQNAADGRELSHLAGLEAMLQKLGRESQIDPAVQEATVERLHREQVSGARLIDGVTATLQVLSEQGLRLAIISNAAYSPYLGWTLEALDIRPFFEEIFVSADLGVRKPNPAIFYLALQQLELKPEQAVYVGDDFEKDVLGAQAAGLRVLWFHQGQKPEPADGQRPPDGVISRPDQIVDWVRQEAQRS